MPKLIQRISKKNILEALKYFKYGSISEAIKAERQKAGAKSRIGEKSIKKILKEKYNNEIKKTAGKKIVKGIRNYIEKKNLGDVKVIHVTHKFQAYEYKNYLQNYKGKTVRVSTFMDGIELQTLELNVPVNQFSKWFDSIYQKFMYDSNTSIIAEHYKSIREEVPRPDVKIIFSVGSRVSVAKLNQKFADGIKHCMLTPILEWAIEKEKVAKAVRYKPFINKLNKYTEIYKDGIPESDVQLIANDLQINISVNIPFAKELSIVNARSEKKALTSFNFLNTRLNHVENVVNLNTTECTRDELKSLVLKYKDDIEKGNVYYQRDKNNRYTALYTLDGTYKLVNEYQVVRNEFEKKFGLNSISLKHDTDVSLFIREGCHHNGTVDFTRKKFDNLKHIDMTKAYTQFKKSKYYNGFVGKITDFRLTNTIEGIGFYRITNLKLDNAVLNKLNCYKSGHVYTSIELEALKKWGAEFDIVEGAWGINIDFDFNDEMINGVDYIGPKPLKYFAKYVGECYSINPYTTYYMKGTKEYFENLNYYFQQENINNYITIFDNEGQINCSKENAYHKSQITGFITAYQRLNVIEQLFNMDINCIRQVCVDGIYYKDHKFIMNDVFRHKDEIKVDSVIGTYSYCSGIDDDDDIDLGCMTDNCYRKHYARELFLGAGGNGKTHYNLTDNGLINKLYVAPTYKLASAKASEYGIDTTVLARLINPAYAGEYDKYACLIIDEASMMNNEQKELIFKLYPNSKIILCGDIGYQLPPVSGDIMTIEGFDNVVEMKQNFRFKCPILKEKIDIIRNMIRIGINPNQYICDNFNKISNIINVYKKEDMILCSRTSCGVKEHDYKCNCTGKNYSASWSSMFPENKFLCKDKRDGHYNGTIVYEKPEGKYEARHGFTVHSVQGETFKNKIFIDSRNLFDMTMGYTAVSRAEYFDQIYIIV